MLQHGRCAGIIVSQNEAGVRENVFFHEAFLGLRLIISLDFFEGISPDCDRSRCEAMLKRGEFVSRGFGPRL
jgi:hypothetical protein